MTPQTPPTDRPLTAGDWIEWHGGENPVPGQKIHWRNAHGAEHGPVLSNEVCGFGFPSMPGSATTIAYRLARPATSAASEAAPFAEGGIGHAMQERGYAYLKDYVLSTDGADYEPNEFERALLEDFMGGLLGDEAMFGPVRALLAQQAALASPPISELLREARWYVNDHQQAQPNDESKDLLARIDGALK